MGSHRVGSHRWVLIGCDLIEWVLIGWVLIGCDLIEWVLIGWVLIGWVHIAIGCTWVLMGGYMDFHRVGSHRVDSHRVGGFS